jgi:hypothetical protein
MCCDSRQNPPIRYGLISQTDSAAAKALIVVGGRPARILERLDLNWGPPNPGSRTTPVQRHPPRAGR